MKGFDLAADHVLRRASGLALMMRCAMPSISVAACVLRDAGREAAEHAEDAHLARQLRVGRDERQPQLAAIVVAKLHAVRHDADDRRGAAVDAQDAADHIRIAIEAVVPEVVADDDDGLGAAADLRPSTKVRPSSGG